ncbi:MAG: veratrol--corrinoid protein metyltransferase [Spirochaetaceae bacterium]|jgi:hypothetical protein|nr:veratrol--corrinoid protein metyltransferase [Spirochaetaceae bacterium]
MATLTPKENWMRIGYGKEPEWIPSWSMGMGGPGSPATMVMPSIMMPPGGGGFGGGAPGAAPPREWVDQWGVPYIANEETGFAGLPKPGAFILQDINDWEKVVKHPPYPDEFFTADWEAMAKKDLANIDRTQTNVLGMGGFMPFQQVIAFMGFTEGLCALMEEPDAVKDMLNYIADYYVPICERIVEYYKPDLVYLLDDTASKDYPFFSLEVYRDIFKPIYKRLTKTAFERGIPLVFHNCGCCEDFVPDMIDFGVHFWDPAQTKNDLLGIKAKYGDRLAICGGWDFIPPADRETTEEDIRSSVRAAIDKYAPGGAYSFCGGVLGKAGDFEKTMQMNGWAQDEVAKYGANYYKK